MSRETKGAHAVKSPLGGGHGGPGAGLGAQGEKPTDFGRAIGRLASYARRWLPALGAAVVLAALGAGLNVTGPQLLSQITDAITAGLMGSIDIDAVVNLAAILLAIYAAGFAFNAIQGLITATVSQRVAQRMRTDVSSKSDRMPLSFLDRRSTGDVLSIVTNDVDTVGQSLNQSLGTLVSSTLSIAGSLVMMLATNVAMTLVGVAASLLGFIFMMLVITRSQRFFTAQQNNLGRMNGLVEETFSGHTVVRAYSAEQGVRAAFSRMNGDLYRSSWKSQFFSGLTMPLMSFVGNLGYVAVCVTGAVLVLQGSASFGTIVAFMLYIRLFTQPLSQIAQALTSLQSAAAACERVFAYLDEPELPEDEPQANMLAVTGGVTFDHVRFGYESARPIIKDFSFNVAPGSKVAIVGPTGAGKTTLVNLLMHFYDLDAGEIRIDGTPISMLSDEELRSNFAMVLQDSWLITGTIRDNIAFGMESVTDEQIVRAARAAGLDHFVSTLPGGYDTMLDENAELSAGQRQLITIARAMLRDAPILILDEATSSVDTRTEALIQKATDELMRGRTSFVIAHRLSTIRDADVILVLRDGNVVEHGSHEELMAAGGFYADLYLSQFEEA